MRNFSSGGFVSFAQPIAQEGNEGNEGKTSCELRAEDKDFRLRGENKGSVEASLVASLPCCLVGFSKKHYL